MDDASHHYVHLNELADGVGRRLAQLTRAEWGIVTAGCAAALTHATAACIAAPILLAGMSIERDEAVIVRVPFINGIILPQRG
jgi:hypothetical protein